MYKHLEAGRLVILNTSTSSSIDQNQTKIKV